MPEREERNITRKMEERRRKKGRRRGRLGDWKIGWQGKGREVIAIVTRVIMIVIMILSSAPPDQVARAVSMLLLLAFRYLQRMGKGPTLVVVSVVFMGHLEVEGEGEEEEEE